MSEAPPSALVEKYRALASELNDLRARLKTGERRPSRLRAAILMFDPHFRFATVPVKFATVPIKRPKPAPEMSERSRMTWDVLRTAAHPMTAHGIAKEVLALSGAAHVDSYAVEKAAAGVYALLARQEKRGTVRLAARSEAAGGSALGAPKSAIWGEAE